MTITIDPICLIVICFLLVSAVCVPVMVWARGWREPLAWGVVVAQVSMFSAAMVAAVSGVSAWVVVLISVAAALLPVLLLPRGS